MTVPYPLSPTHSPMSSDTIPLPSRSRSRLLGGAAGELTFSVLTGEHQGQEVRIRGPKCTIGSARGCTLRLRARGVAGVHCWILRGAGGTVVRRRHRSTQLNGQAFDDAPLKPGDRLRIGSVELEVRQCPVLPEDWSEATAIPAPAYDEVDRQLWERTAQVSAETIDRLQAELQEIERRTASQVAELSELTGRLSAERDALQEQLRQLESSAVSQQESLAALALAAEKQELEAALAANRQELAELHSQAALRQAELQDELKVESRRAALMQLRLDKVLGERAVLEAKLQDERSKVHGPNVDRQAELERLQDECRRLNEQVAQLRELLGYTSSDRDRALREIEETQHRLLKQQQQLEQDKRQLAQLLDETKSEKAAVEAQLRAESTIWHSERDRLHAQQERMNEHSRQLEGQLTHVRELVETLAAERDSLCQQLEAADLKQSSEHETFQFQRAAMEDRLASGQQQVSAFQTHLAELTEQLTAQKQRGEEAEVQLAEAQARAAAAAERADAAERQLAELQGDSSRMTVQLSGPEPPDEQLQQRVAELQLELSAKAETLAAERQRAEDLDRQLTEARTSAATSAEQAVAKTHRLEEIERQLTEVRGELDSRSQQLAAQGRQLEEADRGLAELRDESSRMTIQLSRPQPRDEEAEQRLTHLDAELAAKAAQLAAAEQRIAELEAATSSQLIWQREAQEARDELSAVQTQLADSLARLEAERAAAQSHGHSEHEQRMQWEQRAGELQYQLAAAELKVADAENRLEALRAAEPSRANPPADNDRDLHERIAALASENERLRAESARASALESEAAEDKAARAALEKQLAEFKELVQAEREALHRDRDRVHQECRVLGHKLIQKQKDLDALQEQVRAATAPASDPSRQTAGTITMEQIHRQFEAAAAVEEERTTWFGERDQLRREIEQLRKQLTDGPVDADELTLGRDEVSKLRAAITGQGATQTLSLLQPPGGSPPDDVPPDNGESDRQALAEERSQLAAEREQLAAERRQLDAINEETQTRRAELQAAQKAAQDEIESRQRDWDEKLREKERLLDARAQELADKLATGTQAYSPPPAGEPDGPSLAQHQAALGEAEATIAELQVELQRLRERTEHGGTEVEQADCEPSPTSTASSSQDAGEVESMLSQLVETGVWQGDDPAAGIPRASEERVPEARIPDEEVPPPAENVGVHESVSVPASTGVPDSNSVPEHCAPQFAADAPPTEAPQPVWNQPDTAAPPDDDDSIEAYMSRLLKRVRGDAPGGVPSFAPAMAPVGPAPKPAAKPAAAPKPQTAESQPVVHSPQPDPEPVKPEEYLPRQKAPEHSTDLEAMRELANSAARGAIVKAQKRSGNRKAIFNTIGAAMTLTCAIGTGYWAWRVNSVAASAATAIGVIAAAYWGSRALGQALRALLLTPQMLKGKTLIRRRKKSKDPKHQAAPEQLAAEESLADGATDGGESLPLELIPTAEPPPERGETLSPD